MLHNFIVILPSISTRFCSQKFRRGKQKHFRKYIQTATFCDPTVRPSRYFRLSPRPVGDEVANQWRAIDVLNCTADASRLYFYKEPPAPPRPRGRGPPARRLGGPRGGTPPNPRSGFVINFVVKFHVLQIRLESHLAISITSRGEIIVSQLCCFC